MTGILNGVDLNNATSLFKVAHCLQLCVNGNEAQQDDLNFEGIREQEVRSGPGKIVKCNHDEIEVVEKIMKYYWEPQTNLLKKIVSYFFQIRMRAVLELGIALEDKIIRAAKLVNSSDREVLCHPSQYLAAHKEASAEFDAKSSRKNEVSTPLYFLLNLAVGVPHW